MRFLPRLALLAAVFLPTAALALDPAKTPPVTAREITTNQVQILGPGSTGDVSGMSVKALGGTLTRRQEERATDVIYAADFGMVCNGKSGSDATPGLVAAMNVSTMLGGREIVLPPGTCRLLTALDVQANLALNGRGLTTIYVDPTITLATSGGLKYAVGFRNIANVRIEGVTWQGGGQDTAICQAGCTNVPRILAANASNVTIRNSTFRDFGRQGRDGNGTHYSYIQGLLAFGGADWLVDNSKFINNSGDGIAWSNGARRVEVRGSYFENNGDSGPVCTINGSDFNFHDNYIVGQAGSPAPIIVMDRCQKWQVRGNTVVGVADSSGNQTGQAIRVARYTVETSSYVNTDFVISGNTVIGTDTAISVEASGTVQAGYTDSNSGQVWPAVNVGGGGRFAVTGNTVTAANSCIVVTDSEFGTVQGNACSNAKINGLLIIAYQGKTGSLAIGPNTFQGTGAAGSFGVRQLASGGTLTPIAFGQQIISGFQIPTALANNNAPLMLPSISTPTDASACSAGGIVLGADTSYLYVCVAFNAIRKVSLTGL